MRRIILGILALSFLSVAGSISLGFFAQDNTLVLSLCLRMGLVLGAMWLAYNQVHEIVQRTPPWVMGGAALGLLVVVVRPRAIVAIAPLLAGAAALHWLGQLLNPVSDSKKKAKPPRQSDDRGA